MSSEKLYSEIFDEFEQSKTKQDRIAVLRKYDHPRFRDFLFYALNTKIHFDVEVPQYRPAEEPAGLNYTYLDIEMTKIYRFIKDHPKRPPGLTSQKQKQLLLVILESLHKDEAEIMAQLVQKKFKVNHLTMKLVQEAYGI
jgi:hypothetical protein